MHFHSFSDVFLVAFNDQFMQFLGFQHHCGESNLRHIESVGFGHQVVPLQIMAFLHHVPCHSNNSFRLLPGKDKAAVLRVFTPPDAGNPGGLFF